MKKAKVKEMRAEYKIENLGKGMRGKYYKAFKEGTNLVLLSPDVAKAFPNDKAVNDALRELMKIAQSAGPATGSSRRTKHLRGTRSRKPSPSRAGH